MKRAINKCLVSLVCLVPFQGCLETAYQRGKVATYTAVLGLESDDLSDQDLKNIKLDIDAFLSSGQSLTTLILSTYSDKIAEKLNRDPRRIRIVLSLLATELDQESGPSKAKEFIQGVSDTLTQLGY